MTKFEVPCNMFPDFVEKFRERPELLKNIDCFYVAAWKDDCDNTRIGATLKDNYPKTYEEYVERLKDLMSLGIPISVLAQRNANLEVIEKYMDLGIRAFTMNDDELAKTIKRKYPDVKLTLSITRCLSMADIQDGDFSMYDRIVLFYWFNKHLDRLGNLPKKYKYVMLCNCGCYYDCKWHDAHWFIKANTLEDYYKGEESICKNCQTIVTSEYHKSAFIQPEDIKYFEPYVTAFKLIDRIDHTELIVDNLNAYVTRFRGCPKGREYYSINENS